MCVEVFKTESDVKNDLSSWFMYRHIKNNIELLEDELILKLYNQLDEQFVKKYTEILGTVSKARAEIEFLMQFESEQHIVITKEKILSYINKSEKDT